MSCVVIDPVLTCDGYRLWKEVAKLPVECFGQMSCELNVLQLIFSHWNMAGSDHIQHKPLLTSVTRNLLYQVHGTAQSDSKLFQ